MVGPLSPLAVVGPLSPPTTLDLLPLAFLPADPFPEGILPYALGGLLIGLGASIIYLGTGIAAGASTFLESTLSYVSSVERFERFDYLASRRWRLVFTAGIVAGAALYTFLGPGDPFVTRVSGPRLFVGGLLVGIGTRVGKGCTSGHGVCGMGSLSQTSIVNVLLFVLIAAGTAHVVEFAGVTP